MIQRMSEKRRDRGEKGFTLIELLVVIIILGILAAVVVFAVGGIGDKGQTSACKIDTRTLRTAQEAYSASPTGGAGTYTADEGLLVQKGFLSEQSNYHNIIVPGTRDLDPVANGIQAPPFDIVVADDNGGATTTGSCGTVGNYAGQTPSDV